MLLLCFGLIPSAQNKGVIPCLLISHEQNITTKSDKEIKEGLIKYQAEKDQD